MRLLFLIFCIASGFRVSAQNVSFAQRNPADTGVSVYFDQFGMLYPPVQLSEAEIKESEYSIKNFYLNHTAVADSLFENYGITTTKPYPNSALQQLNDSLMFDLAIQIEAKLNTKLLVFGIHGYRKSYLENQQDVTSVREYSLLNTALERSKKQDFQLVQVYWDATYDCCYSMNRKNNLQLFELFETAYSNADNVGRSFQTFLSYFNENQIGIVAHSLGSKVAVKSVINCKNSHTKFSVALVEPAISADLIREEYNSQSAHPDISWLIYYNEKDFVLKKKDNKIGCFGPGCYAYGETTLGMNKKRSAEKLQQWMSAASPPISCQLKDMTELGKAHSLRAYLSLQDFREISEFLTTTR